MRPQAKAPVSLLALVAVLALGLTPWPAQAASDDEEGVRQAILDYVEGVYEVAPERIRRSVHPDLHKFGYSRRGPDEDYHRVPMTFDQLVELAATYNVNGRVPADAPKDIELFEVLDKTASAKLTAHWGVDYFHLAKIDGKWMIVQVLWQRLPQGE